MESELLPLDVIHGTEQERFKMKYTGWIWLGKESKVKTP